MPVVGNENYNPAMLLEEAQASTAEVFSAGMEQAFLDNPLKRVVEDWKVTQANIEAKENNVPRLTKAEAEKMAGERGLQISNIPEMISKEGFELIAERQYQKKLLDMTVASGDSMTAQLAGGLLGSLVDPINVASSFIPIPGINGLTRQLAKTGSNIFTRSLVRAQIGVAEGVAGAALIEAGINIPTAGNLGDNYGLGDSAMNILTGAVGGALLHPGIGAAIDYANPSLSHITNLSPQTKGDYAQTVMAQFMDDRPVNTDLMNITRAKELADSLSKIDEEYKLAEMNGNADAINYLDTQRKIVQEEMHEDVIQRLSKLSETEVKNLQQSVNGGKGSRYLDDKEIQAQDLELNESIHDDVETNVETLAQEEILTVNESAKQMGLLDEVEGAKNEVLREIEDVETHIKEVEDFTTMVKSFAKCVARGR